MLEVRRVLLLLWLLLPAAARAQISFQVSQQIPVGQGPTDFLLLEDDPVRLLIANDDGLLLLGANDGELAKAAQIPATRYVKTVAAGSLATGRAVAYADRGSAKVWIARRKADGSLGASTSVDLPGTPRQLAIRSIGNDPSPAVLVAQDNGLSVLRSDEQGVLRPGPIFASSFASDFATADLDADGVTDLLVAGRDDEIELFAGQADGRFEPVGRLPTIGRPARLRVCDVNGDSRLDIVVLGETGLALHLQRAQGGFGEAEILWKVPHLSDVLLADLNGDGAPDALVTDRSRGTMTVLAGSVAGEFQRQDSYLVGRSPERVLLADVTGDGRPDALTLNRLDGSVTVLPALSNGRFRGTLSVLGEADDLTAIAVADFNQDRNLDLAVTSAASGSLTVFLGDGQGRFQAGTPRPIGRQPRALAAGDLDGDPFPDLAIANFGGDEVAVLAGDGRGGFAAPILVPVGFGPAAVAADKFSDSGHLDLAVANLLSDSVSILYGDGKGRFPRVVNRAVVPRPNFLLVGDLTGDGFSDLAVGSRKGESVAILHGDGKELGEPEITALVGVASPSVAEDLDGDGEVDLVVVDEMSDSIQILPGIGAGQFGAPLDLPVGRHAHAVAAGDFDGDGRPDLALVHRDTRLLSILLNRSPRPARSEPDRWRSA